jgi:RHS repeat-associated protein
MFMTGIAFVLSFALGACEQGTAAECSLPDCAAALRHCTAAGTFGACYCVLQTCDDNNACTLDGAAGDPDSGYYCENAPRTGQSCSDGNACTVGDSCRSDATCQSGTPITAAQLDDGSVCTVDYCNVSAGIVHAPVPAGTACKDGNVCNGDETCDEQGVCEDRSDLQVDDGDVCTIDRCDPAAGVQHETVASCGEPASASPTIGPDPLAQEVATAPNVGGPVVVEHTGEATYSYPFGLPKARGRYQPALALTYGSGRDRNVGFGQGWSLTTSYIEHDPSVSPDHHWLTIDGATMALVDVSGNKTRYRPEVVSGFLEATYTSGSSPRWTVVDGVGNTYRFDIYRAGPGNAGGRWYLASVSDVDDNTTTFSYLDDGGASAALQTIGYNGAISITMSYEDLGPGRFDRVGATVVHRRRMLRTVTTSSGLTPILTYRMQYGLTATRTPVLEAIEVVGTDGAYGPQLPPTRFTYEDDGGGEYALQSAQDFPLQAPQGATEPGAPQWLDLDGDGRLDAVFEKKVVTTDSTQWELHWSRNVTAPGDSTVVFEPTSRIPSSMWEGTGLDRRTPQPSVFSVLLATVRDMNGDRIPDLVWARGASGCELEVRHGVVERGSAAPVSYATEVCYARSNLSGEIRAAWTDVAGDQPFGLEYSSWGTVLISLMDADGDRELDYVFFDDSGWRVFHGHARWFEAATTLPGSSNFGSASWCPFNALPNGPLFDLNGDGFPDAVNGNYDSDCNGVMEPWPFGVPYFASYFGQGQSLGGRNEWYWYDPFSLTGPWTPVARPIPDEAPTSYACPPESTFQYMEGDGRAVSAWIDLDGDGRGDHVYKTQGCASGPCPLVVYWNTGGGFAKGQLIQVPSDIYPSASPLLGPPMPICLCRIAPGESEECLGTTTMRNYFAQFLDLNADGVADHVSSKGGAWQFYAGTFGPFLELEPDPEHPGGVLGSRAGSIRLRQVTTPTGARYAISYAPAARFGEAPQYVAQYVVTRVALEGPRTPPSTTVYVYGNPAVGRDRFGALEPRGFEHTWVTDGATGSARATTWAVGSYVFTGSPLSVEWLTSGPTPDVFKRVSYAYAARTINNYCMAASSEPAASVYPVVPVTTSTTITNFVDWLTLSSSRTKTCNDVDANGNELRVRIDPDASVTGDELYEWSTYDASAACKACKVSQRRTADEAGAILLSHLKYWYDSAAGTWNQPSSEGQAGEGHLNFVTAWVYNPATGLPGSWQTAAERIAYNANGTVASRVRPAASPVETDVVEAYTYDDAGVNVTRVRTSDAATTLVTDTQYDFAGRPTLVTGPYLLGSAAPASTKAFRYDHFGRVIAVGRALSGSSLVDVIAATVYVPALMTEDGSGWDEGGAVKRYTFSAPITVISGQSLPEGPDARISVAYLDALGRTVQVRERLGTGGTASPASHIQQYANGYRVSSAIRYDGAGRPTAVLEPFFSVTDVYQPFETLSAVPGVRGRVTRFDHRGWVTCSASGVFAAVSADQSCTSTFQGPSHRLSTGYRYRGVTRDGRVYVGVEALPPAATAIRGTEAFYAASGLLGWTADAYGNEVIRGYDREGRLASITRRGYGNVVAQSYSKQYDSLGRVVAEHDPNWSPGRSTPSRLYHYDAQSRLAKVQLSEQRVGTQWARPEINYEYGSLGRRTRVFGREPVLSGGSVTFAESDIANVTYDRPFNGDGTRYPFTAGTTSWVASPLTTIAFGYDRDGGVARRDQWFQGIAGAFSASSTRGNDGRVLSSTFESPYSKPVTFTDRFDTAGQPVRLELGGTALWEVVQVDPDFGAFDAYGRLAHVQSNGGLVDTYRNYDPNTQDLLNHVVSASGTQVYGIDRIVYFGTKLQSFGDDASGTDYAYHYDSNARLQRATATSSGGSALAQSFDDAFSFTDSQWQPNASIGNLEKVTSRAPDGNEAVATFDYVDDRVVTLRNGPLAPSSAAYEYDIENHLRRVVRNGAVAEQLEYDPNGALLARKSADQISYFVGDLATITLPTSCAAYGCAVDPSSIRVTVHAKIGGTRAASVRIPTPASEADVGSDVLYYHRDRQGSVIATTVTGGRVGYRYRYDAYGLLDRILEPAVALGVDATSDLGYTGGLKLSGSLLHLNARVYDPRLRRFLQADSVDLFRYAYVAGDPANATDPAGLMPMEDRGPGRMVAETSSRRLLDGDTSSLPFAGVWEEVSAAFAEPSAIDRVTAQWFGESYLPENRSRLDGAWRAERAAKAEAEKLAALGMSRVDWDAALGEWNEGASSVAQGPAPQPARVTGYWEYHQSTGEMWYYPPGSGDPELVGTGHSGNGAGRNNPDMQGTRNVGPVPEGLWQIEPIQDNVTGRGIELPDSMRLTPLEGQHERFNRSGFIIHGGRYSEGCVILPRDVRLQIGGSGTNHLSVVP